MKTICTLFVALFLSLSLTQSLSIGLGNFTPELDLEKNEIQDIVRTQMKNELESKMFKMIPNREKNYKTYWWMGPYFLKYALRLRPRMTK